MSTLLAVEGLSVVYKGRGRRKDKTALDDVSVSIGAGETLGLVGESGSGKSTFGGCVLGLVRPASGSVRFDGEDITHASGSARRALSNQIQAVFQDPYSSFNPHRTIEQSVGETLVNDPTVSRAQRCQRVVAMLDRVGLDNSALSKFPAQFSGGQRQRIAIARALLPEPRLVVCDESVSALDLSVQAQVLNLLLELQRERGVAYLFITHDLAVVQHMSTRVAVLEHGRLVEQGEVDRVIEHPTEAYTRRLIAASPQSDPDLQDARRATRRALLRLGGEAPSDRSGPGAGLLRVLETQAVAEVLARPLTSSTGPLDRALSRLAEAPGENERLVGVRAAIVEMSSRTDAEATAAPVLLRIQAAREEWRAALATASREQFVVRCHELSAAIRAGDRNSAQLLVASLDAGSPQRAELSTA